MRAIDPSLPIELDASLRGGVIIAGTSKTLRFAQGDIIGLMRNGHLQGDANTLLQDGFFHALPCLGSLVCQNVYC